jgi:propanol-preferring alcohol dehydrogenase
MDLMESLAFAADGKVKAHYSTNKLENINAIFTQMAAGQIDGRIVLDMNE